MKQNNVAKEDAGCSRGIALKKGDLLYTRNYWDIGGIDRIAQSKIKKIQKGKIWFYGGYEWSIKLTDVYPEGKFYFTSKKQLLKTLIQRNKKALRSGETPMGELPYLRREIKFLERKLSEVD